MYNRNFKTKEETKGVVCTFCQGKCDQHLLCTECDNVILCYKCLMGNKHNKHTLIRLPVEKSVHKFANDSSKYNGNDKKKFWNNDKRKDSRNYEQKCQNSNSHGFVMKNEQVAAVLDNIMQWMQVVDKKLNAIEETAMKPRILTDSNELNTDCRNDCTMKYTEQHTQDAVSNVCPQSDKPLKSSLELPGAKPKVPRPPSPCSEQQNGCNTLSLTEDDLMGEWEVWQKFKPKREADDMNGYFEHNNEVCWSPEVTEQCENDSEDRMIKEYIKSGKYGEQLERLVKLGLKANPSRIINLLQKSNGDLNYVCHVLSS